MHNNQNSEKDVTTRNGRNFRQRRDDYAEKLEGETEGRLGTKSGNTETSGVGEGMALPIICGALLAGILIGIIWKRK